MNKVAISLLCLFVVPKIALADVTPVGFPKTIADVSFEDRVAVMAEGYKPFMDKSVYKRNLHRPYDCNNRRLRE